MNKEYIKKFCKEFNYPKEAITALNNAAYYINNNNTLREMFKQFLFDYNSNRTHNPAENYGKMTTYAKTLTDFPYETIDLLFFILHAEHLEDLYKEAGLPHAMWHDAMDDLRCKLFECYKCKGIWGTFVGSWFPDFFNLVRVALGRIQYQPSRITEYVKTIDGKFELKSGDLYIDIHIPSSGPLLIEDVMNSLKLATEYFAQLFKEKDYVIFGCDSWLLFNKHREWLPASSGIVQFMNLFSYAKIYKVNPSNDLWRIFNTFETSSAERQKLPEDTLLRRKYKEFLMNGGKQGSAFGLIKIMK